MGCCWGKTAVNRSSPKVLRLVICEHCAERQPLAKQTTHTLLTEQTTHTALTEQARRTEVGLQKRFRCALCGRMIRDAARQIVLR